MLWSLLHIIEQFNFSNYVTIVEPINNSDYEVKSTYIICGTIIVINLYICEVGGKSFKSTFAFR